MPEVPIYEHRDMCLTEDEVGSPWQVTDMGLEVQTLLHEGFGHDPFRTGPFAPDMGHDHAALLGGHDIPTVSTQLPVSRLPIHVFKC